MSSQEAGFTLIELVVVIVLIGVLAGAALPRVFKSVASAKKASVQAVVATMSSSLETLQADYLIKGVSALPASFVSAGIAMTPTGLPLVSSGVTAAACQTILTQLGDVSMSDTAKVSGRVNYLYFGRTSTSDGILLLLSPYATWWNAMGSASYGVYGGVTQTFAPKMGLSGTPAGCFYFYNKLFPNSALVIYYTDQASPAVGAVDLIGLPFGWWSGGSSDGF